MTEATISSITLEYPLRFAHGGWTEDNAVMRSEFGDWRVLLDRFAALADST